MRFLIRRTKYRMHESDLQLVEEVMCSGSFILIDLFFWSTLMTLMTLSLHYSLLGSALVFTSSYLFGAILYFSLKKWLGEPQD
ncbi:hypothetical protein ACFYKT_05390 [Cytobacillus sp. FJAT-53684]|uniref:SSD domain-containing protein n=1 Tax=Cytobacillus mangrovibacter TaxID=3299024 RepID=A0ABW6JVB3_9BACI